MAAAGDSCGGGASKPEMLGYRMASRSDVNKAVLAQIKPKIKHITAILPWGRRLYAFVVLGRWLLRAVTTAASIN